MFNNTTKVLSYQLTASTYGVILPGCQKPLSLSEIDKRIENTINHIDHFKGSVRQRHQTHGAGKHRIRKVSVGDQMALASKRLELLQSAKEILLAKNSSQSSAPSSSKKEKTENKEREHKAMPKQMASVLLSDTAQSVESPSSQTSSPSKEKTEKKEKEGKVQPEQKSSLSIQEHPSVNDFLNEGVMMEAGEEVGEGNPLMYGPGRRVRVNGGIEEGIFQNGQLQHGKILYPQIVEQGTFHNGQLHGPGQRTHSDGTIEQGNFQHGILQQAHN